MFLKLAIKSLFNRKGSVILTLMAMTVSVFILFAVEHIRHQTKENFAKSVSGVDLIVGARTGSLNLLLYSVFHVGAPTNNVRWQSFEDIRDSSQVAWAIPIALGDSHKGYRVVGTSKDYFKHFTHGDQNKLVFEYGAAFEGVFEVVLGSEVAKKLDYSLGDKIILSHGIASTSFSTHDDYPFTIVGVLKPTGTPIDQTIKVSLAGIEAIHLGWQQGVKVSRKALSEDQIEQLDLKPKSITAFMLGLNSRMMTFRVQRAINTYDKEPMMAILPGVALSELWRMMGILERTLLLVTVLVFVAAILGLSAMLLSSIHDRAREIRLLRVVGAPPSFLFLLIELEALLITCGSLISGAILLSVCLVAAQDFLLSEFGLLISANIFSNTMLYIAAGIIAAAATVAAIPSLSAYGAAKK